MWVRIALYYLAFLMLRVFGGLLFTVLFLGVEEFGRLNETASPLSIGMTLLIQSSLAPLAIAMTAAFVRFVDNKSLIEVGGWWPEKRHPWIRFDLGGALLGAAFCCLIWFVLARILGAEFEHIDPAFLDDGQIASMGTLLLFGLGFLATAAFYEWMWRGYIYSTLRERHTWANAAGFTSILFVTNHWNPELGAAEAMVVFLLGLVLGAIRELTGSVWPVVVFHAAWNFTIGCLLSLPLSGNDIPRLYAVEVLGDPRLTGGDYGPEGSWLMVPILLAVLLLLALPLGQREQEELSAKQAEKVKEEADPSEDSSED